MYWKRLAHALTLGIGFSVVGSGCAVVDALVSSSAGVSAYNSSPEHMAAIGRVFENQGRLAQASRMYRGALKSDPGNDVARERLQYIAAMRSDQRQNAPAERTRSAMAVADSLAPNPKRRSFVGTPNPAPPASPPAVVPEVAEPVIANYETEPKSVPVSDSEPGAQASSDSNGWELAGLVDSTTAFDEAQVQKSSDTSEESVEAITPVGFETSDIGVATVASMESEWQSSQNLVSLEDVTIWMENPVVNRDNLIRGLESGEDDGVRAIAAVALTECSFGDEGINESLAAASYQRSELLQVTALDSLIQRSALSAAGVDALLSLLKSRDSDIQSQAAASLRNLAGTEFAPQCAAGLARLLTERDSTVVAAAAITLGDFEAYATEHRAALIELASSHQDSFVIESAELALRRIPANRNESESVAPSHVRVLNAGEESGTYLPPVE